MLWAAMIPIPCKIFAYSVTDIITINSTLNGNDGDHNIRYPALPIAILVNFGGQGWRARARPRRELSVCLFALPNPPQNVRAEFVRRWVT
jgi:hypothetical protein